MQFSRSMRKETYEELLRFLNPGIDTKYDWRIHKRLDETRRVYVCPARGNNKVQAQLELYAELMAQNKDIKIIRAEDLKKAVDFKDAIIDKDLYYNSVTPWFEDALDKHFENEMKKWLGDYRMGWEPKIIFDSWPIDNSPIYNWKLYSAGVYSDCFIIRKEDCD